MNHKLHPNRIFARGILCCCLAAGLVPDSVPAQDATPPTVMELVHRSQQAATEHRMDEALDYARQATERDAGYDGAWRQLGVVLSAREKYEQALDPLETAVLLNPDNPANLRELRTAQWRSGRTNEVLDSLEALCRLEPENPEAWRELGSACQAAGQNENALKAFSAALELNPDDAACWRDKGWILWSLNRPGEALEAMNRALSRDLPNRQDLIVQVIARLLEENHPEQALALLAQWEPDETLLGIAIPLVEKGRLQAARPLLKQAWDLKENPRLSGLYLANAQSQSGTCDNLSAYLAPFLKSLHSTTRKSDVQLLLSTLRNCVDLIGTPDLILEVDRKLGPAGRTDPGRLQLIEESAAAMEYRHQDQAAVSLYRKLLERDPDRRSWLNAYELIRQTEGPEEARQLLSGLEARATATAVRTAVQAKLADEKGFHEKAIPLYEESLAADPAQPRLYSCLFDDYLRVGDVDKARAIAELMEEKIYDGDSALQVQAGEMWSELEDPERALDWWQMLHLAHPSLSYYAVEEANACYRLCRPEEAIEVLEEQIERHPTPQAYELLTEIRQALGQYALAADTAGRGLADTPSPGLLRMYAENSEMIPRLTDQTLETSLELLKEDPGHVQGSLLAGRQMQALGHPEEAVEFYQELLRRNPDSFNALVSLKDISSADHRFAKALDYSEVILPTRPGDVKSILRHAIALSEAEHVHASLQLLRKTVRQNPPQDMVPVLLYRDITTCAYPGRNTLSQLLGHLQCLHDKGYELVTPMTSRPQPAAPQAIIILEEADTEVLEAVDAELQKTGGQAVYAGHPGVLTRAMPGKPPPVYLEQLTESGRWLIASSGPENKRRRQISSDGLLGNPYTHPIFDGKRMETENTFRQRLEQEFRKEAESVRQAPERILIYPFGDYGQLSLDTEHPWLQILQETVSNHFDMAFFYDDSGFMSPSHAPLRIPARTVPAQWDCARLIQHLTQNNPAVQSRLELAKLLYWNSQHEEANYWFSQACQAGADPESVHFNWGANAYQQGDLPTALRHLRTAQALDPENFKVQETLENAVNRKRIRPDLQGLYWKDNEGRTFEQYSIDASGFVGDGFRPGALANWNRWATDGLGSERGLRLGLDLLGYLHPEIWAEGRLWQLQMDNREIDDLLGGEARLHLPNRWLSGYAELSFSRQEIETVEALRAGIHADTCELATYSRFFDKVDAFVNGRLMDRNDDNDTWLLYGHLVYRLKEWPYLGAGYLFRFGDSDLNPAEYWAPEQLEQHQAYANLRGRWHRLIYSLAGQAGVSREMDTDWKFIWGGNAQLTWEITRRLSLRGEINYQESETYDRTTANAGASVRF